jgi:hypothetical protein
MKASKDEMSYAATTSVPFFNLQSITAPVAPQNEHKFQGRTWLILRSIHSL